MARLWTCGFELQSTATNVEVSALTGTASISTTVHRSGAAALRCNPTAGSGYIEHQVDTAAAVKRTLHRFYLRIATLPSAATAVYAIGQSGFFPCHLRLGATGTLQLYDSSLGAAVGTASAALSTGVWYRVEIDHTDAATGTATVTAYLNGVSFGTGAVTVINGFSRIRVGVYTPTTTADIYIDDLAVNDVNGSAQTGLPGPGNVVHLRPDSAGDNALWATTVGGTSNWQRVSEVTPDDATTYNATVATGTTTIDDHNMGSTSAAGISGERVTLVQVGGRIGSNAVTAASLVYRIKSQAAGTVLESGSVSVALNGWASHKAAAPFVYQLTSYTDPQAGGAWTTALLDQAQIGYRGNVSQTTARRVSTLWALVETIPITTAALGIASGTDTAQALARGKTQALGVATETSTSRVPSQPLAQLKDDFNDNTVDAVKWPNSFGTYSETGGRARVACNATYNAYSSALIYTLHESSVYLRAYAPAAGGATTEAWAQALIKSIVGGTDLGFELRMTTGTLAMFSRVGYVDAGEVAITYSPTDHAWLRVRETGGTTYWDTSPDGSAWTNRRTATSPAWVADTDLEFQLIAHRSDGVDDFAEFDNVNIGAAAAQALTPASETDTAPSLAWLKSAALGLASESAAAQPVAKSKTRALGTATESEAGQALARGKRKPLAPAASSETAQPLGRSKRQSVGVSSTAEAAQILAGRKAEALGAAGATDAAQPLTGRKAEALALAGETDTTQPLSRTKRLTFGTAGETGTAQPVVGSKTQAIGTATETSTAVSLAPSSALQPAEETTSARPLARSKRAELGIAFESTATRPIGSIKSRALLPGVESAASLSLGGGKARALVPAGETWAARPLLGAKARALTAAGETSTAGVVTGSAAGVLGSALAVDTARQLAVGKRLALGVAVEVSQARIGPYFRLGVTVESSSALALAGSRQRPADRLTAGTSGPTLKPGTGGPVLAASSSGPNLSASVTSGGG